MHISPSTIDSIVHTKWRPVAILWRGFVPIVTFLIPCLFLAVTFGYTVKSSIEDVLLFNFQISERASI